LNWSAVGETFFDDFNFLTHDPNNGASHFLGSFEEARTAGVVEVDPSNAVLRAGPRSGREFKRQTVKVGTKKAWKYFLAMLKFSHVPFGCGVWPAFFTLGQGRWPMAGEMDILEYVHDFGSMTSFHSGKQCKLNRTEVNKFTPMPDANVGGNLGEEYNCYTEYCGTCHSLGCAPNVLPLRTGQQWAERPGIVAMERTADFAKIFFIPEAEIPQDVADDAPRPEEWSQWLIAHYPFGASAGCPDPEDVMAAQYFILSIAFCGDWASKVWGFSPTCVGMGPEYNATASNERLPIEESQQQCRSVDPLAETAPEQDCCTQFIADPHDEFGTDAHLKASAFFNISYFKIYT